MKAPEPWIKAFAAALKWASAALESGLAGLIWNKDPFKASWGETDFGAISTLKTLSTPIKEIQVFLLN